MMKGRRTPARSLALLLPKVMSKDTKREEDTKKNLLIMHIRIFLSYLDGARRLARHRSVRGGSVERDQTRSG